MKHKKGVTGLLTGNAFVNLNRWHLPTLPPLTAVPSAVRGLTALFEMEEVNTRLTSTNLIDSLFDVGYPSQTRPHARAA